VQRYSGDRGGEIHTPYFQSLFQSAEKPLGPSEDLHERTGTFACYRGRESSSKPATTRSSRSTSAIGGLDLFWQTGRLEVLGEGLVDEDDDRRGTEWGGYLQLAYEVTRSRTAEAAWRSWASRAPSRSCSDEPPGDGSHYGRSVRRYGSRSGSSRSRRRAARRSP
jgi:hypothetical protein